MVLIMKMKRLPYKRLIAGVTRQVKYYIKHRDSVRFNAFIYADPFTGDVRLDDCPDEGHYCSNCAMFLVAGILDDPRTPDTRRIEHWVRADLRQYAERIFRNQCNLKRLLPSPS